MEWQNNLDTGISFEPEGLDEDTMQRSNDRLHSVDSLFLMLCALCEQMVEKIFPERQQQFSIVSSCHNCDFYPHTKHFS